MKKGLRPAADRLRDAKLLQVLFRQALKNRLVYLILAENGLVLPEAQVPQPDHNVHERAPRNWGWRASSAGETRVSRVVLGQGFAKRAGSHPMVGASLQEREALPGRGPVGASRAALGQRIETPALTSTVPCA
jgi:hypothetical protein